VPAGIAAGTGFSSIRASSSAGENRVVCPQKPFEQSRAEFSRGIDPMSYRFAVHALAVAALALPVAPRPAAAGDAGAFVGGVAAGVLGTLAVQHARQPQRVVVQKQYVRPQVSSYQREANRQVQTSLNYFGFPAGTPDGVLGANSRSAIAQYQAFLGDPATGALTDYERTFLTSSYDRAIVGGAATTQTIAASGQGTRGLLLAYRQEQLGVPTTQAVAVAPPVAPPAPVAPAGVTEAAAVEPGKPVAAMPSFIAGPAAPSMGAMCNRTGIETSKAGGPMVYKVGARLDAWQAVDEQFCLARSYAIDDGTSLAATAQGFTQAQIEEQCAAFAPSMRDYVGRLVTQKPAEVTEGLRKFVADTGIPAAQLSANARICLGVGYGKDDADVALASALVLVGLGEGAYDELIGYHLLDGFGTPERGAMGVDWLGAAIDALSDGATPLVTTDEDNRLALLQTVSAMLLVGTAEATVVDSSADAGATPAAPQPEAASATAAAPAPLALPKPVAN